MGGMGHRLDMALPVGAEAFARALADAQRDAVFVGGAVRDALLGRVVCDLDMVTDASPELVREVAAAADGVRGVYAVGERFGTLGVILESGAVLEVSAYRPIALAGSTPAERFEIDAGHRDFTVNALGWDLASHQLLDPLGGRADLETGVLRTPGSAVARFAEDPLRVLRAGRLVAQLGFDVEETTELGMRACADALRTVAVERVRMELTKLLLAHGAPEGMRLLLRTGALEVVLPEVAALDGVTQPTFHDLDVLGHTLQAVGLAPATTVLRWATLLHDVGKAPTRTVEPDGRIRFFRHAQEGARIAEEVCCRLRFSKDEAAAIVHLVGEHMRLGDVNPESARSMDRAVRKLDLRKGPNVLATAEDALELTMADFSATAHRDEAPVLRARLTEALAASRCRGSHRPVTSPIGGAQLMHELGVAEGPLVGVAKQAIVSAIEGGALAADDRVGALRVAGEAVERAVSD